MGNTQIPSKLSAQKKPFRGKVGAKLVSHIDATEHKENSCDRFSFFLQWVTIVKDDAELEKIVWGVWISLCSTQEHYQTLDTLSKMHQNPAM